MIVRRRDGKLMLNEGLTPPPGCAEAKKKSRGKRLSGV